MARGDRFSVEEKDKKKVSLEGLKRALKVFKFIKPYQGYFFAGMVFLAFSSATVMAFPYITGHLVDSATGSPTTKYTRNQIALSLIGILVVQGFFSFMRVWLFSRVSENGMRDIRSAVYSRMLNLPIPYLEKHRVGELTSRLTADISQLQDILSFTLAEFVRQFMTLLVGIGIILATSFQLTMVMLASFPVLIIGAIVFGKFIRGLSKKSQDELAAANTIAEETLQAIQVVKAFTNEAFEAARYGKALNNVVNNALKAAKFRGFFISFVIFAIFGGIVLVLWYGLGLVAAHEITIGNLVSFIIYTTFIGGAVGGMGDLYGQLQKTIGASERVMDILDQTPEHSLKMNEVIAKCKGLVRFDNVVFSYPARPDVKVLKGISFEIKAGEKIALAGQSGAGKSTISSLLLAFYRPDSGHIFVDGTDIAGLPPGEIRAQIGVVPQEVLLFGGTIAENIAYARPNATTAEIEDAAKKANAWEFIKGFPEGLATLVGERGIRLSGGQRQRIAIARAILKDPAILILDEATSSLDAESEKLVQDALDRLMENRTTIIIAHRLGTIRNVDTIYVLSNGTIGESGGHDTLAANPNGLYANLLRLQLEG